MDCRRLSRICFASALALVGWSLNGCGGSVSIQGLSGVGTVSGSGGLASAVGAGTAGTASGSSPLLIPVTFNGNNVNAVLPANETIPPTGAVACLSTPGPLLSGLGFAPSIVASDNSIRPSTIAQGTLYVDGTNTGLSINGAGFMTGFLALVPGYHTFTAYGPFLLAGKTSQLNINSFISFGITVAADGTASVATKFSLTLPPNGGTWAGCLFSLTYPTPDFSAGTAAVNVVITSTTSITQTQSISNGSAVFSNLAAGTIDQVPLGGLQSMSFNVTE